MKKVECEFIKCLYSPKITLVVVDTKNVPKTTAYEKISCPAVATSLHQSIRYNITAELTKLT